MSKWRMLSPHTAYLPGGVNVGVVFDDRGNAVLIDSGGDKQYGRTVRKALNAAGLRLIAIVNTHAHADHYGGNDYLCRQFDVPVWAPTFEEAILRYPLLEPMYLFGGASPPDEICNKWLMAKPSPVAHVYTPGESSTLEIGSLRLHVHDVSGHAAVQAAIGFETVCFAADAFFGTEILEKYEIPFAHDIERQLDALDHLCTLPYERFVPGHGNPTEDIEHAVAENRAAIERATARVLDAVGQSATTDEVVHHVTALLTHPPTSLTTYVLMRATITAHLVYLARQRLITPHVEQGVLRWVKRT
nr:MBL fold metallo-hydrolase [Ardenticatena sp.]